MRYPILQFLSITMGVLGILAILFGVIVFIVSIAMSSILGTLALAALFGGLSTGASLLLSSGLIKLLMDIEWNTRATAHALYGDRYTIPGDGELPHSQQFGMAWRDGSESAAHLVQNSPRDGRRVPGYVVDATGQRRYSGKYDPARLSRLGEDEPHPRTKKYDERLRKQAKPVAGKKHLPGRNKWDMGSS